MTIFLKFDSPNVYLPYFWVKHTQIFFINFQEEIPRLPIKEADWLSLFLNNFFIKGNDFDTWILRSKKLAVKVLVSDPLVDGMEIKETKYLEFLVESGDHLLVKNTNEDEIYDILTRDLYFLLMMMLDFRLFFCLADVEGAFRGLGLDLLQKISSVDHEKLWARLITVTYILESI